MEGQGDAADRERMNVENSAVEGDGDRGRCSMVRCASQSSLDESSQRPAAAAGEGGAGGAGGAGAAHARALLHALAALRHERALCDVRLLAGGGGAAAGGAAAEGQEGGAGAGAGGAGGSHARAQEGHGAGGAGGVAAHRAVLAACSPYFRAMFTQFDERTQPTVTIQDVEPQALEVIVDYIYNPESLIITEENVQSLLSGASLLQVLGVRALCCAFLAAALAPDNALGIRAFADLHACAELAAQAQRYVDAHAHQVLETEEFLALPADALAQLLDSDRLTVPSEEVILDAVIRWMQHEPEERSEHLGALLEHVRLPLVAHEALVARAAQPPLAAAGVRVKDLLIEALSFHLLRGERRAAAALALPRARPRHPPRAPRLLLVVGGQAPKAIRDVEALHLECGRWVGMAELPARRCRAGVAAVAAVAGAAGVAARGGAAGVAGGGAGGAVLAVGGFNGTLRVRSVDVYDVCSDTWRAGPPLTARRSTLGVAVIDDKVYAVGGFDGATGLSSAEVLEAGAAAWRPIASMSTRRSSVGVAALRGRLYAVGGYDGAARQCLHSVERYDPARDVWEPVEDMSVRRSGAGVGVLGSCLYAVGGHDGPAVRRSVERYTEGAGWSAAPGMAHARRNAGVAAHAGKLYVVGGDDGAANLPTVEVFDPATETWTLLPSAMSVGRSYAGVCVVERAPA